MNARAGSGAKVARRLSRTLLRIALVVALLLVLAIAVGATFLWTRIQTTLEPTGYKPQRALLSYAAEPDPVIKPAAIASQFSWNQIANPPRTSMPWIRWWWPGADVQSAELNRELQQLHDAGFGGAEIQPFAAGTSDVIGDDAALHARVYKVDSPTYLAAVRSTLTTAKDLGLQIDLTHYSGWPGGSPAVSAADGLQNVVWGQATFSGGRHIDIDLPRPCPRINALASGLLSSLAKSNFAEFDASPATFLSALVAVPVGGSSAQLSIDGPLRLNTASIRVVDASVRNGRFSWDAPAGNWVLLTFWLMPSGQRPVGAAFPSPAYAVNPVDSARVRAEYNYVFGDRTRFSEYYGGPFRAIFNDSLEFTADRLGAADILDEFQKRRGYDLRPLLPAIFLDAADNTYIGKRLADRPIFHLTAADSRIRHDYQQTLSDLMIERFFETTTNWAHSHGLQSRAQPYGFDLDVIKAEGIADIPETEQLESRGDSTFLKTATSAALLYGKDIVSAESMGFPGAEYTTNAAKMKASADLLFLDGINQLVYHGFPYNWRPAGHLDRLGPQGWQPFAGAGDLTFSENYSPRVPLWADMKGINLYVARAQNLLRQGKLQADVLIYYPAFGVTTPVFSEVPSEPLQEGHFPLTDPSAGFRSLIHVAPDSDPLKQWLGKLKPIIAELDRRGVTWQWVNPDGLRNQLLPNGRTRGGSEYGSILFAETDAARPDDIAAAERLAAEGIPVHFFGKIPDHQPGYLDAKIGDVRVRDSVSRLLRRRKEETNVAELVDDIVAAQSSRVRFSHGSDIRRIERILDSGSSIEFFSNLREATNQVALEVPSHESMWWFDALTGTASPVPPSEGRRITLELRPYESRFLIVGEPMPDSLGPPAASSMIAGAAQVKVSTIDRWSLEAGEIKRVGPLFDWRADPALRYFGSVAIYRATINLDHIDAGFEYHLDVGLVPGVASVNVNGKPAGSASIPPGDVDITALVREGSNQIEILYQAMPRNNLIGRALDGDKRLAQWKGRADSTIPVGIGGPVSVFEFRQLQRD
ncbi:glycosyl hydrolase [Solimonas terrae]|uniref:Glycoside hydrolase n=1 Tax=Solimonas terrae TaxID=1396819 RepID=A0A6M2BTM8_9GAMM|nr:glycosyl hydrolase [Solimonas terrae]NGY05585.1 hypothetical protein [Solimonas terrae]